MDEQQMKLAEELLFSGPKQASFAKALYHGLFDGDRVFPYPTISPIDEGSLANLLQNTQQFLDEKVDPQWIDQNSTIPDEVIRGLGDLGVLGVTIPPEYGGLGMSQHTYCRVEEIISHHCASTALFINAHQSVGLKALQLFGTEKQKQEWLAPLAQGKMLAAFALTEPGAGSDAGGVQTRAEYIPEKKVYRINGEKQWITNGSIAGMLTVMARTWVDTPNGKEDKITAFIVSPDMPGFEVTAHALDKVGMRGSTTSKLAFHDLEVPEENILGEKGKGLKLALTVLDYGRTTFGATCTGAAKLLFSKAVAHAKERHQFSRPLGSFALVKKKIAAISALVYAMDASTYLTAGLLDKDEDDFMLETAILKVFASDSLWTVLYETMQILGGRSLFTDEPYERMMRDARLNMIGEGSNEVMRAFIGSVGLRDVGMRLQAVLNAAKRPWSKPGVLFSFMGHTLGTLSAPKVPVKHPHLRKEAKALGKLVQAFGWACTKALGTYKEAIIERQIVLDRLATAVMAIYSSTAVLSKLDYELSHPTEELKDHLAQGKYYCSMAMHDARHALHHLCDPQDQAIESLSDQLTGIQSYG